MRDYISKIKIILRSVYFEPRVFWQYCLGFIISDKSVNVEIISTKNLAESLLTGKSLIRVGDGEAMLLMGRDIHYQAFHEDIRRALHQLITTYTKNSSYILAIPTFALTESTATLKARGRLRIWRLFRSLYKILFKQDEEYADAVVFYHQNNFTLTVTPVCRDKHVIVVSKKENNTNELQQYMNQTCKSWEYIEAPSTDAYNSFQSICNQIDTSIEAHVHCESLLLFAVGPTSKVLVLHYQPRAIQCIDIGHGIEILGRDYDYSNRL